MFTRNPNSEGRNDWPRYSKKSKEFLVVDTTENFKIRKNLRGNTCRLLNEIERSMVKK